MKKIALAIAVIGAATVALPASAQLAVKNGSFEVTGVQYSPALGGLNEATDWVNTSALPIQASSALSGVEGTPPAVGNRFLRLVSDNPNPQNTGSIYQLLGTIIAGQRYTITGTALGGDSINNLWGGLFSVASASNGGQLFGGTSVLGLAQGQTSNFSFTFAGTAANAGQSAFLRLAAIPSGPGQDIRGGVDNIQLAVSAVPEPAAWGLMILGFGAIGVAMRRRAKVRTTVSFA